MVECDSLWCCWLTLLHTVEHVVWVLRWPLAVYAALYAVGAAVFLLSLRFKSRDGRLVVDTESWAYMLAHPMRYGGHRVKRYGQGSICAFYARLFNMLLFVWPIFLLYFLLATTVGSVIAFVVTGHVMWPKLSEEGFMYLHRVTFPVAIITIPAVILSLLIWKHAAVFHFLKAATWVVLCSAPLLVFGAIAAVIVWQARDVKGKKDGSVSAVREVFLANKERFCKLIEFS